MTGTEKLKQIRAKHPYPWTERVHPNGLVQVIDAAGNEVGIFELTTFVGIITASLHLADRKAG